MKNILETKRLMLRPLEEDDLKDLKEILQDPIAMKAYEHAFSDEECQDWLSRMMLRQRRDGISLYAVILKETGEFAGQCGLTMQDVEGQMLPEVGYLFKRRHWHKGYATEASGACIDYGFNEKGFDTIYCIVKHDNYPSQAVALRNGMSIQKSFTKHYMNKDMPHYLFSRQKA
ncbi:MAG: GNAT family N-acetyltransferase [Clostridiaceae bacterium]|nr:GNAT family N-acetyltransferase [Clostridiaceae bacterium]